MCAFLQTDNILWPQVKTVFAVVLLRVAAAASQLNCMRNQLRNDVSVNCYKTENLLLFKLEIK